MATTTRVTLQQFLAVPESKPYRELVDGEVCEKPMPNQTHGVMVARLIHLLMTHQDTNDTFHIATEVRYADVEHSWVFLPDISVTLNARLPGPARSHGNPVEVMPDFAIEVLSPEDRPGMVARKITFYRRADVTLLWIIDPETETITVWERGADPYEAPPAIPLSAAPILADFGLDIRRSLPSSTGNCATEPGDLARDRLATAYDIRGPANFDSMAPAGALVRVRR